MHIFTQKSGFRNKKLSTVFFINLFLPAILTGLLFFAGGAKAQNTYIWNVSGTGTFGTAANWTPLRNAPATNDILVIDGLLTAAPVITSVTTQTIGQLKLTNNTNVNLQSAAAAILTISGGTGTDFDIPSGSVLNISSTQSLGVNFTGTQAGNIAGTLTVSSTGAGTMSFINSVTTVTGTVNHANASYLLTGSTASLIFSSASNYNYTATISGTLPLATWNSNSNVNITGLTSNTALTNIAQTYGNFTWNCAGEPTGVFPLFQGTTATVSGNLNVQSTGAGRLRILSNGTLTVLGSVNVTGGGVDFMNGAANLSITGNLLLSNASNVNVTNGAGIATIGGNVTISNTAVIYFGNAAGAAVTTISGNLNYNSSGISLIAATSGTAPVLNVLGNFSMTAGQFGLGSGTGASTMRVGGTFSKTGGAFGTSGTGTTSLLEFNGAAAQSVGFNTGANGPIIGLVNVRLNNSNGINLTGTLAINAGAAYTISNGSTIGSGSVLYNTSSSKLEYNSTNNAQTATALEFPLINGPVSLTINNTNTAPNNYVAVPFSRTLGTTGILTLTAGILDNSGNVITVSNTAFAAIAGGSATSYVKGGIARILPAGLVSGSTYSFPVGKTGYNPFDLFNPVTNSGGTVTVQVEVFDGNSGGTPGVFMGSISTTRYWAASIVQGAGNFSSSFIRLFDIRGSRDAIGASTTLTGAYDHIGGTSSTLTSTSITSTAPAAASIPGFFVMGNLPAATLSDLTINPEGNQCTNVSRQVTVTATPGGAPVSGIVINYQVNGGAVQTVNMTNTGENNWLGIIPTVTPVNGTVTWSVTATDANSLTSSITGTTYKDAPLLGVTSSASALPNPVCSGSPTTLTARLSKAATFQIGTGITNAGSGSGAFVAGRNFYGTYWGNARQQWLIRASELTALGFTAGNISSLSINVLATGTPASLTGFTIKMANTSATTITTAFLTPAFTTVWGPVNYTPVTGINTHTFSSGFVWDGTSSVVLDVCHANQVTGNASATNSFTAPGFNCAVNYGEDGATGAGACNTSVVSNASLAARPNIILTGNTAPVAASYSWSDGTGIVGTTNPLTVSPAANTTYTATITASGCTTTASVSVTTSPLPAAPLGTSSIQCGTAVPGVYVVSAFGGSGPFKWYSAATGGTLLQNGGTTYTSSVNTTTSFWVSETNGSCESARTEVIATVTLPDPVQAQADNSTTCANRPIELSVIQEGTTQTYSYSWTALPVAGSGIPTSLPGLAVTVTPTAPGSYVYTVTAVDGDCITTSTVTVSVPASPSLNTPVASPATICSGFNSTLTATTQIINAGSATIGTGTLVNVASSTTATAYPAPFGNYYRGALNQMLITAAELTASGLRAGNITSLAFDVVTPKTTALTNFNISLKSTALTSLSTLQTGLTTVYSAASYTPSATPAYASNTIPFLTAFNWDGVSNIIIQTCFANTGFTTNAVFNQSATSYTSTLVYREDAATVCTSPGAVTFSYSQRPNIRLGGQVGTSGSGNLIYQWNPGNFTGNTVTVSPATTTTYTVQATDPGTSCTSEATVTVTVIDLPAAPSGIGSEQCGTLIPTASVSSNSSAPTPVFRWYNAMTGGTLLQSGTSVNYGSPVSVSTDFYVAEVSAEGCEGPRTQVTVSVITADPVTASSNPAVICIGSSFNLTATQTGDNNTYAYTWTASPAAGSGIPSSEPGISVIITPSAAGTYEYTVTATDPDKGCQTTGTINVTVGTYPVISSVNATPSVVCSGGAVTLAAATNVVAAGTAGIGTATTLTTAITQPTAFCNRWAQYWSQTVYTAAEMTAAGLRAGNITAITYNISTLGDAANNTNFTIKIGTTAGATVTGFVTAGLTNVYGPSTYVHAVGLNTITFSVPYSWDGISNLLIDIRHDGVNDVNNSRTYYTATAGNTTATATSSTSSATQVLATTNPTASLSTSRLNIIFSGEVSTSGPGTYNWVWNPGALSGSTVTANPLTTTSYEVTATDPATGCSATSSPVNVTVSPVSATASVTPATPVCSGTTVALTATPGGGGPFGYSWSNGTTVVGNTQTLNVSPLTTTTYTVTVTDACNQSATAPVTVTVNPLPTASIAEAGPISICAPATQVLTAVTNAASPTYQWKKDGANIAGATSSSYTVTSNGSYSVTVTNNENGCTNTSASTAVTINPVPVFTVTPPSAEICDGSIVTLNASVNTISATAGTGVSTSTGNSTGAALGPNPFQIYYGGTKQQMLFLASELSSLGMSAGSVISSIKFNLPGANTTLALANLRVKMKNTTTASLTTTWESGMTVVRAAAAYTPTIGINTLALPTPFTWNGSQNLVIEVTYSNNNTGTTGAPYNTAKYSPTSFSSTIFYREDNATAASLNIYTGAVSYSYNQRNDVTFDFTTPATVTWAPVTGLYSNAAATTAYTGSPATTLYAKTSSTTTYTATAASTSGCTKEATVTVTVNPHPTGVISGTATYCAGQATTTSLSIAVTGTGPWTGTLSNGTAFSGSASPISISVSPAATTIYTLSSLSDAYCASLPANLSGSATVTVNARPTATISGGATYCAGQNGATTLNIAVTGAGPWNGTLSDGTAFSGSTTPITVLVTPAATTTYTIATLTDAVCAAVTSDLAGAATVTFNPRPTGVLSGNGSHCSGDNGTTVLSVSVTGSGPWNGTLSDGTSFSGSASPLTVTVAASSTTIYTLTTLSDANCASVAADLTGTVTVTVNPRPTAVISGGASYCEGQPTTTALSIVVTGTGPWNGTLSDGTAFSGSSSPISVSVTPTATTTYTVATLTDALCIATASDLTGSATVTVNPLAASPTATVTQPTCTVATGTITVTSPLGAGTTYSLDGGAYQSSTTFSGVAPGTHSLTAQTSSGCFSPASSTVTVDPQPFIPAAPVVSGIVNVCPYVNTGEAVTYTASAAGATSYIWTLPPNTTPVSGLGTATITVTFASGFTAQPNKQIKVRAVSSCGTGAQSTFFLLAQFPSTPGVISGPTDVCPLLGSTAVYSVAPVTAATGYNWTAQAGVTITPNGTGVNGNSVTVSFPAGFTTSAITVQAKNECGTSGIRSLTVTRNNPAVGPITGPSNVCPYILPNGTAATYSVVAVAGVTSYNWTVPANSVINYPNGTGANGNTITVQFPAGFTSGAVTVSVTNGCGTSAVRSLSLTKLNPATPGVIDVVQTQACPNRVYTYTISTMPANATSLQWTIPSGATLVSGQGTTSITVSYPGTAVSGAVTAQAVNNCGASVTRSVTVKLPACPAAPPPPFSGTNGNPEAKGSVDEVVTKMVSAEPMEVRVFPNPAVHDFKVQVLTSGKEMINVRVVDLAGRLYKEFKTNPGQVIALGSELKAGAYIIEVRQGSEVRTTKVIKF